MEIITNVVLDVKEIGVGYKVFAIINGEKFESLKEFDSEEEAYMFANTLVLLNKK